MFERWQAEKGWVLVDPDLQWTLERKVFCLVVKIHHF
jgi:hypothetical protein